MVGEARARLWLPLWRRCHRSGDDSKPCLVVLLGLRAVILETVGLLLWLFFFARERALTGDGDLLAVGKMPRRFWLAA